MRQSRKHQCKRVSFNLKSDGHGSWLDSRGNFVATTEDGKLKFLKGKSKKKEDEGPAKQRATDQQTQQPKKKPQPTQAAAPKSDGESGEGGEGQSEVLTVAFGRFNPPTVGHGKLLSAAKKAAAGGDLKIYPSRSQDPKKNPLDPDMKVSYMKKMFPEYEESIVNDDEMRSIFNVLTTASEGGYKNVNIIVGSDRQSEFESLATKYNGELYDFDEIRVISAGVRDADADGVEGMSASKMRKALWMVTLMPSVVALQRNSMMVIPEHCSMLFAKAWVSRKRKKLLRCGRSLLSLINKD